MNKKVERAGIKDLVECVVKKVKNEDVTKKVVEKIVRETFNSIVEILDKKESLRIVEFGNFKKVHVPKRKTKIDGKEYVIPEHNTIKFKASKKIRERL
jgi:nucleoid DNA-binding protein